MQQNKSYALFTASQELIPGGVNSPVRAFRGVNGEPRFIAKADKAFIYDEDGNSYIDFVGSWGPMILGHNHHKVAQAVTEAVANGLSYGAPTAIELEMAQHLTRVVPNLEMVRMVSSGTEATMSAIRLARGYTQRNKIIKFDGCYHGHSDSLLVKAGSGVLTFGVPGSSGVTEGVAQDTLIAQYNDLSSVQALFNANPSQIACVIVEPVAGNMNCVPPTLEFLQGLRSLCTEHGTVLIFDEVMTGFRCGYPGAQTVYGVDADLITLGKIIGAGMPVGAFGGKRYIMQCLAPLGGVYQAGTLSGNPVAMSAGLALLKELEQNHQGYYQKLEQQTNYLLQGLQKLADANNIPFTTTSVGSMFGIYFRHGEVQTFADVQQSDVERFKKFHALMLEHGVYFAPSAFEAGFVSLEHTNEVLDKVLEAAQVVFAQL